MLDVAAADPHALPSDFWRGHTDTGTRADCSGEYESNDSQSHKKDHRAVS